MVSVWGLGFYPMCESPQLLIGGGSECCGICMPCLVARRVAQRERLRAMFSRPTWKGGSYV